jgi:hypothetical protein
MSAVGTYYDDIKPTSLALAGAAAVGVYATYKAIKIVTRSYFSSLRDIPGPENPSFIYGNLKEIWDSDTAVAHERWIAEYGHTLIYNAPFNVRLLDITR